MEENAAAQKSEQSAADEAAVEGRILAIALSLTNSPNKLYPNCNPKLTLNLTLIEGMTPEEEAKWKDCATAQTLRAQGKEEDAALMEMMAETEFPGIVERFKASAGASSSAAPTAEDVSAGAAALQVAYDAYERTEGWLDGIAKMSAMQEYKKKDINSKEALDLEMEISGSDNMDMIAYLEVFEKIDVDSSGALSGTEIKDGFMPAVDSAGLGGLLDTAAIMTQLEHMTSGQDFVFADFCALLDVCLRMK